jgi:gamma-glutamylaminecyclotransferase
LRRNALISLYGTSLYQNDFDLMNYLIFACGTLKRGFPLHHSGLHRACYLGEFKTVEHFPLVVAGRWFAPMLLHLPGEGERVHGELYEVDQQRLLRLDAMESMDQPGNFRFRILVEGIDSPELHLACAYFKSPELAVPIHTGFLADYRDDRFIPPDQRDGAS